MNKPASTLSIRLQLPPDDEEQRKPEPDEVIYLWDRILLAALAATIVVVGIVAGAWYALSGPEQEQTKPAVVAEAIIEQDVQLDGGAVMETTTSELSTAAVSPADNSTNGGSAAAVQPNVPAKVQPAIGGPAVKPLAATPAIAQAAPAGGAEPASSATSVEAEAKSVNQPTTSAGVVQAAAAKQAPATAREPAASRAPSPAVKPAGRASATPNIASALPVQQPAKVEVLSDHLMHAQLSNRLVNRKPLDLAPAVIPMNEEGLITVYFYTELQDMKGETVYYNWYRDDKRVARVRARPQRQVTRAYSSKFIDRYMLGNWRVELDTAGGQTLARAEFEVRDATFAANAEDNSGS